MSSNSLSDDCQFTPNQVEAIMKIVDARISDKGNIFPKQAEKTKIKKEDNEEVSMSICIVNKIIFKLATICKIENRVSNLANTPEIHHKRFNNIEQCKEINNNANNKNQQNNNGQKRPPQNQIINPRPNKKRKIMSSISTTRLPMPTTNNIPPIPFPQFSELNQTPIPLSTNLMNNSNTLPSNAMNLLIPNTFNNSNNYPPNRTITPNTQMSIDAFNTLLSSYVSMNHLPINSAPSPQINPEIYQNLMNQSATATNLALPSNFNMSQDTLSPESIQQNTNDEENHTNNEENEKLKQELASLRKSQKSTLKELESCQRKLNSSTLNGLTVLSVLDWMSRLCLWNFMQHIKSQKKIKFKITTK